MQTQQSQLTKKTFLHENDVEREQKKNTEASSMLQMKY